MGKTVSSAVIIYLLFGMVLMPKLCLSAAGDGLELCINVIIPSLFPFFVCSKILVKNGFAEFVSRPFRRVMRPIFNVPACGAFAFVIGIISGCPVGARTVMDMYTDSMCTSAEAQRMVCFCNNSGPLFIMGSVAAGMLGFPQIGAVLYFSQVLSAVTVGVVMANYKRKEKITNKSCSAKASSSVGLAEAVSEAVSLTGYVCGFVIFFAVATAIFRQSGFVENLTYRLSEKNIAKGILFGMLEMTNGISFLSGVRITSALLCAVSFVAGFGGLSVILQVSGIISRYGLSTSVFVFAKLLQGIVSAIFTWLMLSYTKISLPVFGGFSEITVPNMWALSINIFAVFGIIILILSILSIGCKILRRM